MHISTLFGEAAILSYQFFRIQEEIDLDKLQALPVYLLRPLLKMK